MEKKVLILPNVKVIKFEAKDLITTSNEATGGKGNNGVGRTNYDGTDGHYKDNPGKGGGNGRQNVIAADPTSFVW